MFLSDPVQEKVYPLVVQSRAFATFIESPRIIPGRSWAKDTKIRHSAPVKARSEIRATYSIAEAARLLGISEKATRAAVKRGDLEALTLGGRVLILKAPLLKLLQAAGSPREDAS